MHWFGVLSSATVNGFFTDLLLGNLSFAHECAACVETVRPPAPSRRRRPTGNCPWTTLDPPSTCQHPLPSRAVPMWPPPSATAPETNTKGEKRSNYPARRRSPIELQSIKHHQKISQKKWPSKALRDPRCRIARECGEKQIR